MDGSDHDVLVCAEYKLVSDRLHLSELRIPGLCCPQQRMRNSTPGDQDMPLNAREGFLMQVGVFLPLILCVSYLQQDKQF